MLNKETLSEVVTIINDTLPKLQNKLVITGSFALCCYDLVDEINDIDIVVHWKDCAAIEKYIEQCLGGKKMCMNINEEDYDDVLNYKVVIGDYTFNFLSDTFITQTPLFKVADNIWMDTLNNIITAKKHCKRQKDAEMFKHILTKLAYKMNQDNDMVLII